MDTLVVAASTVNRSACCARTSGRTLPEHAGASFQTRQLEDSALVDDRSALFVFIEMEVIPLLEPGLSDNFHSEIRIDRKIENEPAY